MRIIFVYGLPACGKFTICSQLSKLSGFKLFHNHLVVDTLLSVFEFGSPPFIKLREQFWLSVFAEALHEQEASHIPGIIFTFSPDNTVSNEYFQNLIDLVQSKPGHSIHFVEVVCSREQLVARVNSESRTRYKKLTDAVLFENLLECGAFSSPALPPSDHVIDSCLLSAEEAAAQIATALSIDVI